MLDTLNDARMATVPVPLKFTHALTLLSVRTKAVVASAVVLLPGDWVVAIVPVGRVGVPVKVGLARSALFAALAIVK